MTIRQLIKILSQFQDQNLEVMVKGYDLGVDNISNNITDIVNVALNVNQQLYRGSHEVVSEDHTYTDKQIIKAIVLR